jgi:ATP synthase protein I
LVWGGVGWALDRFLGTGFFLLIGLVVGAGAAITIIWYRFGRE